jgi:hypothetical protein
MSKVKKLPRFPFKGKGPLTEEEHQKCVRAFGPSYDRMLEVMESTGHIIRGRIQSYRGKPAPCGYVYYSRDSFVDCQRGRMYIVQNLKDRDCFEIVFRLWEGKMPIPSDTWNEELGDDRYGVCKAGIKLGKWQWKAFCARSGQMGRAKELVMMAKTRYEEIYEEAMSSPTAE